MLFPTDLAAIPLLNLFASKYAAAVPGQREKEPPLEVAMNQFTTFVLPPPSPLLVCRHPEQPHGEDGVT